MADPMTVDQGGARTAAFPPLVHETPDQAPGAGTALCLSGGGFRAMLFHLGALTRLNEAGWLPRLSRVSSVSGGSITAGVLAAAWRDLRFDGSGVAQAFDPAVAEPLHALASSTIDVLSFIEGALERILGPGRAAQHLAGAYDDKLFHGRTLQDLPDDSAGESPRFVFNATSLQTGSLWRFSRPYARDWRVGVIERPAIRLADAVAASSAFPPVLSPLILEFPEGTITPSPDPDFPEMGRPPYTTRVCLTDGGVYDNLGLETAWKNYRTVLVSDGGAAMAPEPKPASDLLLQTRHVLDVIDNQVRALRVRQLIASLETGWRDEPPWPGRDGTFWGIRTDITHYGLSDALPCPHDRTLALAAVATRLATLDRDTQNRLVNWGYAVTDAAMRRHVAGFPPAPPRGFPLPGGVG